MPADLEDLTSRLLLAARRAGADAADAMAVEGQAVSIDIRAGRLEQAERAEGTEIGLRVLIGQQQACVSASDISEATIARLAERAVAMAREAPADPFAGLADPSQLARGLGHVGPGSGRPFARTRCRRAGGRCARRRGGRDGGGGNRAGRGVGRLFLPPLASGGKQRILGRLYPHRTLDFGGGLHR